MTKKHLNRIIRFRDSAIKQLKMITERFNMEYHEETQKDIGPKRKQPPQYDPHK